MQLEILLPHSIKPILSVIFHRWMRQTAATVFFPTKLEKVMYKTLIALAVLALSATVQAAPAEEGVPLHPINDGRYSLSAGYVHENAKVDQLKSSGDGVALRGRVDIPLAQQHAIRGEVGYQYLDSDVKADGEKIINGARNHNVDVYSGYMFSPSGFKNGGLRVGGGLGYSHGKSNVHGHQTDPDGDAVDARADNLYMKAQVEYEQPLGGGWSITPWTDAQVSLYRRVKEQYTQIEYASDGKYRQNSYNLGLGMDVNKQVGADTNLSFGSYYRYTHDKSTSFTHEGANVDVPKTNRHSFGVRGGVRF